MRAGQQAGAEYLCYSFPHAPKVLPALHQHLLQYLPSKFAHPWQEFKRVIQRRGLSESYVGVAENVQSRGCDILIDDAEVLLCPLTVYDLACSQRRRIIFRAAEPPSGNRTR